MISGTLYRPNGTVWAGGVLTVRLVSTFSNAGQTVVPQTWRVTASAAGVVSLSILVPDSGSASYIFTLPDGTQSAAQLLGTGAAILLQTIFTTALADPTAETELATLIAASAVGLAPATTPRNIVQPTADVVPLTVAARAAGQTANLTEWKNTTGTVVASLSPTGVFTGGFVASGLTVANFSSPNVGQWTNDLGYLTSGAADALFLTPTEGNAAYVLRSGSLADLATRSATDLSSGVLPLARLVDLTNTEISATAAIAWTKLNKTGSSVADLTTRSASDLSSGTLPDARFPATLPVGSGVNLTALNASNLASGTLPDARFPATLPVVSGVNLTALNASVLASGTVPDARFPATLPVTSGVNLTALNASNLGSGTVPDARFPATFPAASGVNLTALNASNLGSGTVPAARLSGVDLSPTTANQVLATGGAGAGALSVRALVAADIPATAVTTQATATAASLATLAINVKDAPYSAVGNDSTDDTAAIQAAVTAACPAGTRGTSIYFPTGDYKITSTITANDCYGLKWEAAGYSTRFIWRGATGTGPMFEFKNLHTPSFTNFTILAPSPSNLLTVGIWIHTGVAAATHNSRLHRYEHIIIDGQNGHLVNPIKIGGNTGTEDVANSNNDFHHFDRVFLNQYTGDGVYVEGTQVYGLSFVNCNFSGSAGATGSGINTLLGGSFTWIGGGGAAREGTFYKIGQYGTAATSIIGADHESTGRLLETGGPSPSVYRQVILDGVSYRSNQMNADGIAINFKFPGSLTIRNSLFGNDTTKAIKFTFGTGSNPKLFTFQNNFITASDVTMAALFPAYLPSTWGRNVGLDASGVETLILATPTYSSGFGTGRTFTGATEAFRINVGTGGTASSGVFTLLASPVAANGWNCSVQNLTALAANRADQRTVQTASTTTTVTIQNQTVSTGAALAWAASDILAMSCAPY